MVDINHKTKICMAAWASGSGKTMLSCGLIRALQRRGMTVQSFKAGPDYIDPLFHDALRDEGDERHCENLDTFFLDHEGVRRVFHRVSEGADISVIEGVMGLYDGLGGVEREGSTYDLAEALHSPVILIVDASKASKTLAALISGMLLYDKAGLIKGVILNKCSRVMYDRLKPVIEGRVAAAGLREEEGAADPGSSSGSNSGSNSGSTPGSVSDRSMYGKGIKVYGYVPKMTDIAVESRYLGLNLPGEVVDIKQKIDSIAEQIEESVDIDGIIEDCSSI